MDSIRQSDGLIEKIIDFSARNRFLVFLLTLVACVWAVWSIRHIPLDAIPDLSDTQVIIYSRWDRSPDVIEDQVTYPIVSALLGSPKVKSIRGFSDFGFSYVYVIFEEGVDIYWARSRVQEYLSKILPQLPEGVRTELGPDASGVGWVYQYALVDESGTHSLQELRSFQDWFLRFHLQSVPGVSEVASLGGFVKQYQVTVDPHKLLAQKISLETVIEAIRSGNQESGGRLLEMAGTEYMIRGRGYAKSIEDFENIAVASGPDGSPVLVKHLGHVSVGPEIRRGLADFNGQGDVVTGTVVMRNGENALQVISRVKAKLKDLESSLPDGVKVVPLYDRSDIILRSIDTLKQKLTEEMTVVALVIVFFLWHIRSAMIPIICLPVAVLLAFIPMKLMGVSSNIMSLGGIAIAIGAMVDATIVMIESAHKRIDGWKKSGRTGSYDEELICAAKDVGRPIFFSLLVIAVSFMPIFALEAQEGRLFKPLAFTKNYAMTFAAFLSITLAPALMLLFVREKVWTFKPAWLNRLMTGVFGGVIQAEEEHPLSRFLTRVYAPVVAWVVDHRKMVIAGAAFVMVATIPVFLSLGREFMPPLNEGAILYMPTTLPGISVAEAQKLLQTQDKILKGFPEVETVFGKAGRIESSTDPAPFSMMETTVILKPREEWTRDITYDELVEEMDRALKIPGTSNAWTMPIKNRIDMLTTGVRTPVGIKVLGSDVKEIERIGIEIERLLKNVEGTRSIFAERAAGGYFLDFDLKRDQLSRYGLSVADAQMAVMSAIGGDNVGTTVEGRQRYPVNVRYARDFRDDIESLKRVLVSMPSGEAVALGQVADVVVRTGPAMIRNENGLLAGYVYVDVAGRDIGRYVDEAKKIVKDSVSLPSGYAVVWSGQYENMQRVAQKMIVVVPVTLFAILFLMYMNTRSWTRTMIILLSTPFAVVGAVWLMWMLGYNMSVAVWVGLIALMGVDAETGVIMMMYLDMALEKADREKRLKDFAGLKQAIIEGAAHRIRPKLMTVGTTFIGLLPILWAGSAETGADVMKRIAAPMAGGIISSFALELFVYPAVYAVWKKRALFKHEQAKEVQKV